MKPPEDLVDLRAVSARFGADPLFVQGPGGNTSLKAGGALWIKASGTRLADAERPDVFVPVDWPPLLAAVARADPIADQPVRFALSEGLKPSIETCVHAVFPQRVVLHLHCVRTLALAVCADARERLAPRLSGFRWIFIDYVKPGARLAANLRAAMRPETNVVVLGNHGVIVVGDSVAAAASAVAAVAQALDAPPGAQRGADLGALEPLAGAGYAPAQAGHPLHGVAMSPRLLAVATGGVLYPDHAVFCGPGATALAPGEVAADVAARFVRRGLPPPPFVLAAGAGALLRQDATPTQLAMAACLGDVLARFPDDAAPRYLTEGEVSEILDWDAEKYRQTLDGRRGPE